MDEPPFSETTTADDVARLAGVSKSAVSRAFTPGASISPKMRAKVEAAANELGYRPNPIARSLTTRRSAIIGVAMANMDQLYAPLLQRLSERLTEEGLRLLLFKANPQRIADAELQTILSYNVDALILASVRLSDAFAQQCERGGVPLVLINPVENANHISTVTGDDHGGARRIGTLIAKAGHVRPAFMAGYDDAPTSQLREAGYRHALSEAGLSCDIREVGHFTFEQGLEAARRLLSRPDRPDAIFCANDSMACATVDVARREFGLDVGREISIVGFDNETMSSWPGFDVTTYTLPITPMVNRTLDLLQQLWRDRSDQSKVTVPGELIVRSSTRPLP
jgi:DNA-binding LacI/PurR family transcriptional regulator